MDAFMINLFSGEEYEDDVAIADMGGGFVAGSTLAPACFTCPRPHVGSWD
jgi:hypothetical protein